MDFLNDTRLTRNLTKLLRLAYPHYTRLQHIGLENVRYSKQGVTPCEFYGVLRKRQLNQKLIYIQLDAYFARSHEISYKFFLENHLLIINSIVIVLNISCY